MMSAMREKEQEKSLRQSYSYFTRETSVKCKGHNMLMLLIDLPRSLAVQFSKK